MARKKMIMKLSVIILAVLAFSVPSRLLYAKGGGHGGGGHGGGGHESHGGEHGGGHEGHGGHHGEGHEGHHGEHREGRHGEDRDRHHGGHHEDYHHGGNYYHRGTKYYRLPEGHTSFTHRGVDYHYWDGAYYTKRNNEYVVVEAPVGAVIPTIPQGCAVTIIGTKEYFECNGITYLSTPQGYQIVENPD